MQKASNNFIKLLKKQKRENSCLLFLDNIKIIKDAIAGGLQCKYLLTSDENFALSKENTFPIYKVDKATIDSLSDSKTPQGVICVAEYIQDIVEKPKTNFLVLDGLQDPGNVGSLIRSAYASGFDYIYLLSSVKPTNSKLIRSSVGAIFKSKVISLSKEEFIKLAKEWELNLIATDMAGENIFNFKTDKQVGLIIGNEGQGISDEMANLCTRTVKIPMQEGIESLNASVSGSIIMYQINKDKFN